MPTNESEFDVYDDNYRELVQDAISFSGVSHDFVTHVKAKLIVEIALDRFKKLKGIEILDVGCGVGLTDSYLHGLEWNLSGADVSAASIARAKLTNPGVNYAVATDDRLPFADNTFDICFTICVMHHVLPNNWTSFLIEMKRVLRPGGIVLVLEHNPLNPLTRHVVARCPFDANAVLISKRRMLTLLATAELKIESTRFFLFAPWRTLECLNRMLYWLPIGAQYCVVASKRLIAD